MRLIILGIIVFIAGCLVGFGVLAWKLFHTTFSGEFIVNENDPMDETFRLVVHASVGEMVERHYLLFRVVRR